MSIRDNDEWVRADAACAAAGMQAFLVSSLADVTYVSGFEVPVPVGAGAELAYGIPLALCTVGDAHSWLVAPDGLAASAQRHSRLQEVVPFATFDHFQPADSEASFVDAVRSSLRAAGLATAPAVLGVQARTLPYAVARLLQEEFPHLRLVELSPALQEARRIKTTREIGLLRRAAAIADIGHNTLAELAATAGRSEFEMWAEITARMFAAVGHEVPVAGELVTGERTRTVAYPNGPRNRVTRAGDAALMDISQRIDGYWSDCTNTHVIGGVAATPEQRRYAKASQAACEAAMDALRPGARASDAWTAADRAFQAHGLQSAHYAGHQIGVTVNELPRLVPYDDTLIEAGMVFSVEPGVYQGPEGDFGARSEKMVLVTAAGPEILSTFQWGIA
ncbi:MAG: aminopeptidase P family protein [Caldilineaceae bacterium]|nr:aminopeptidase P family protein [Caldilineaceae bacterium]